MSFFRTEAQFQDWFKAKICRPAGAYVQKVQLIGLRGFPDLIVVHRGISAFYEVKVADCDDPSKSKVRPTPIQQVTLRKLAAAGAHAYGLLVRDEKRVALWDPKLDAVMDTVVPVDPLLWTCPKAGLDLSSPRWL